MLKNPAVSSFVVRLTVITNVDNIIIKGIIYAYNIAKNPVLWLISMKIDCPTRYAEVFFVGITNCCCAFSFSWQADLTAQPAQASGRQICTKSEFLFILIISAG